MKMHHPKSLFLIGALVLSALAAPAQEAPASGSSTGAVFQLPPLPYALNALEPTISARTLSFHYGKHHQAYVDNLNKHIAGTPFQGLPLEKIVRESVGGVSVQIFNNAAQVWNHTFNWNCMKPGGGGKPSGALLDQIEKSFGSYEDFRKAFIEAAVGRFGSGYVWLRREGGRLIVETTGNADTPLAYGQKPLLTCDLWEHAYYLDFQNRRKEFVEGFLDRLVNWEFVESQLKD